MSVTPDIYMKAWRFAATRHNGQPLPGTELPYIVHVGAVAMEVMAALAAEPEARYDDLAVCCALLHDTVEDTYTVLEEIDALFGRDVAAGVAALTKDKSLPDKQEQMQDSLERLSRQPAEVQMVKLADRIANLQPPPAHWTPEKALRYRDEAQRILDRLGSASPVLARRLAEKIRLYCPGDAAE